MDIKDSYLHGTVGVVKSISVSADKLKYKLADIAGTVKEVTLPAATTSANGLMSSGDKTKLDNLSSTIGNYVTLNTDQEITGTKTFTKQLKFTVADGTAPFTVTSTTKVPNLNADLLDGFGESAFLKDRGVIKADTIETTLTNGVYCTSEFSPINGGYNYGSVLNFRSYPTLTLFYMSDGAQNKPRIWYRNKWNAQTIINTSWLEILTSNSYTNYTVGKDGTGATGTWGINITGNAATADKLKTKRKFWGLDFDGTADVSGNMTGVGRINGVFNINKAGSGAAVFNITETSADTNYINLYVTSTNTTAPNSRPLVLQNGYGNVGIGVIAPTQKLEVNGNVKATSFIGNIDGTYVNKLTGYSKATSASNLATTDTLNSALGKLEYKAHFSYEWITNVTASDTDEYINKWSEIVGFLDSVKEGTDILDEFVTRKTKLTITGLKNFTEILTSSKQLILKGPERSDIINVLNADKSITTNAPTSAASIKNALQFNWYDTSWEIGNIRGSSTNTEGFGITAGNSHLCFRVTTTNCYVGSNVILHAGNSNIKNGVITINGTSITPLTAHQSLANYVTLNTDQVVSGKKLFNNQLIIRKDVGATGASVTDQQHNLLLQVMRYSDTHSVAIGVMPTGSGVIWAKANGIGYNTLYLNPHSKGVAIGCKDSTLPALNDGYYFHIFGSTISNDNITANKFIKLGGTSSQFLKADGSVDSNTYATTSSLGSYLPLAGGTMTGKIYFKADPSDQVWIGASSETSGAISYLDFHITDDAADSFRWTTTQYSADGNVSFTMMKLSGSNTGVATLALTGNMTASGNITATTFIGSLTGNASSATKLQTARTLTIGNLAKTFDGSTNVSWDLQSILLNPTTITTATSWDITTPGVYKVTSELKFTGTNNPESTNGGGTPYRYGQLIVSKSGYGLALFYVSHYDSSNNSYGIKYRTGYNDSYVSKWARILDSTNYNVYSPTLDGIGAKGTWNISITGNAASASTSAKLSSSTAISAKAFSLSNASWTDTGYTFANLASGTYAVQVTSGSNLVASGLMSVYKNLSDTAGDEIPLHVYGTAGWRPYLRTYANKLLISSNDTSSTKRTVTIKIALIL